MSKVDELIKIMQATVEQQRTVRENQRKLQKELNAVITQEMNLEIYLRDLSELLNQYVLDGKDIITPKDLENSDGSTAELNKQYYAEMF